MLLMKLYQTKAIISNNVIEFYRYEEPVAYGYQERTRRSSYSRRSEPDKPKKRRTSNIMRTRNNVRRLVSSNFNKDDSKFVTLTFANNVTDIEEANKEFKKFIQRLRYKHGKFKYLTVIEFQKRGAVHYHMICDLPYIKKKDLADIWKQGFVKINRIKHVDNVGAYVIKYMTKDLNDPRLCGKKAYLTSRGLKKPQVIVGEDAEKLLERLIKKGSTIAYESQYDSEHNGTVNYIEFNLERKDKNQKK